MTTELAQRPIWSKSQVSALAECKRKFALNLKASRDAAVDPVFTRAASLKKLKNRHLWTGSFVHEAIGTLLKNIRQASPLPDTTVYIQELKEKMREQFRASKEGKSETDRLREHEYQDVISPEVWKGHWDTVENSVRWFMGSKWLTRLAGLGPECWKAVDELVEFDVNGIKAYVKIDCAIETEGKFFLIDWKTSTPTSEVEPSLQIAALYAHEVWGADPDQINACAVSVLTGQVFHADLNEESLMNAHLRIEEESAVLEEAKNNLPANPFDVALPSSVHICKRCNFHKLCHGIR